MAAIIQRCGTNDYRLKRCGTSDYRLVTCGQAVGCQYCTVTPTKWACVLVAGTHSQSCSPTCHWDSECLTLAEAFEALQILPCSWQFMFNDPVVAYWYGRSYYDIDCGYPRPYHYEYLTGMQIDVMPGSQIMASIWDTWSGMTRTQTLTLVGCDQEYEFTFPTFCSTCGDTWTTATLTITPVF